MSEPLDSVLVGAVESDVVTGVVALVTDGEGALYSGAFGTMDATNSVPMRDDAIFQIYSMTKPVTSVALMMLIEEGRVDLDAPAADYLPELADREVLVSVSTEDGDVATRPAARPPTVRDLLRHTSGIGYSFSSHELLEWTTVTGEPEFDHPLLHDPGELWTYGAGTYFVGRIVEEVSGQALADFFDERIFIPLGMDDTSFDIPPEKRDRMVDLQWRRDNGLEGEARPVPYDPLVRGDGGLLSTAADYATFMRMILGQGETDGVRLLDAATVAEMSRDQLAELGITVRQQPAALPELSEPFPRGAGLDGFGLGFQVDAPDNPSPRAAGSLYWAGIQNTHFWIDPANGLGAVVLTQVLPFSDDRVMEMLGAFEEALYGSLGTRGP